MTRGRAKGIVATLAIVAVAAVLFTTAGGDAALDPPLESTVLPVSTIAIEPVSSYTTERTFTGTLVAARTAELSFERAGEIVLIAVDQGERVSAGQVLGQLDARQLIARQRQLEAQRDQAAAVLAELEAGPRQETIAAARAELRNLEAQVELQRLNTARREDLFRRKAISKEDYDSAVYGSKVAEAQRDVAGYRLDELLEGTRPEQIQAQRAAVAQFVSGLEGVAAELADCQLIARFDGTVVDRAADEGTVVQPGQQILRIVENDHLEAWIGLPSSTADRLNAGAACNVWVDGARYGAEVQTVLPELDTATRTRRVVLTMRDATTAGIYAGQMARMSVRQQMQVEGYWLPTTALVRGSRGLWSCFAVVNDDARERCSVVEQRDIEVLHTEGERVLVRGMLEAAEMIVSEGVHKVVPGQNVRNDV